jgi:hypothetical protein
LQQNESLMVLLSCSMKVNSTVRRETSGVSGVSSKLAWPAEQERVLVRDCPRAVVIRAQISVLGQQK